MPRRSNEFQGLVAEIQRHLDPGAVIEESVMLPDQITGTKREVDICVRGFVGGQAVVVSIECRDRGRPADVTWIDEMHAKHTRLATNVLVLASHSDFTAEAIRVADLHGIRHIALDDIDPASTNRLFPDATSLWGKTWNISITRVTVGVQMPGRIDENVKADPDMALFFSDGTPVCSAAEMANHFAGLEEVQRKIGSMAAPEHTFVEFGWTNLEYKNKRICLQNLDPLEYWPLTSFRVVATCQVTVNEFPLKHGKFGPLRVAWGNTVLAGRRMMFVATADNEGNGKTSLRSPPSEKSV